MMIFNVIMCTNASGQVDWIVPQETDVDASLRGIAVVDEDEAWVSGSDGVVLHTTDRGSKWSMVSIPNAGDLDFRDVAALRNGVVLLLSAGPGDRSRVFRSTDGGKSWTTPLVNRDAAGFFNAFTFADSQNGILVGDPIDEHMDVYRTRDGGVSWRRERGPHLEQGEYGFAASGTSVAAYGSSHLWIATGGAIARVFRSENSGTTWAPCHTPVAQGNESSGIFSVAFRDPRHGVIVGGDYKNPDADGGNVARTADGGQTWTLAGPRGEIPHKACVRHLAESSWLTVGRTGIAVSHDDGASWQHVSRESFYTFDVHAESRTGWMAGSDGRVARFAWPKK